MACGTPVVTSDVASLPEVVGDAGICIAPDDVDKLAESVVKLLEDKEFRKKMIAKGLARAAEFSWLRNATQTLDIYKAIDGR